MSLNVILAGFQNQCRGTKTVFHSQTESVKGAKYASHPRLLFHSQQHLIRLNLPPSKMYSPLSPLRRKSGGSNSNSPKRPSSISPSPSPNRFRPSPTRRHASPASSPSRRLRSRTPSPNRKEQRAQDLRRVRLTV